MTIKIHKYLRNNVMSLVKTSIVYMANTTGLTISHSADSTKSTQATIPFSIEGVEKAVPYIEEVTFGTVIKKKVDLTAIGANTNIQKDIGKDIGKYDYNNVKPPNIRDLPPGFQEIYKN